MGYSLSLSLSPARVAPPFGLSLSLSPSPLRCEMVLHATNATALNKPQCPRGVTRWVAAFSFHHEKRSIGICDSCETKERRTGCSSFAATFSDQVLHYMAQEFVPAVAWGIVPDGIQEAQWEALSTIPQAIIQ